MLLEQFLSVAGVTLTGYVISRLTYKLLYAAWLFGVTSSVDVRSLGEWAVVTGATGGIGKSFCHELARRGLNVVIVGRNREKLDACEAELEEQFPDRKFRCVEIDFTQDEEIYAELAKATADLEVGVIVNNVGMVSNDPRRIHERSERYVRDITRVNMLSTIRCTHIYLPQMVLRNRGAIINVASSSACLRIPYLAMYASTKAFVDAFTQNLAAEYRNTGLVVQGLLPFVVATKMGAQHNDVSRHSLTVPSPDTYVHNALNLLGKTSRTHGHLGHSLQGMATNLIPEQLAIYIAEKFLLKGRRGQDTTTAGGHKTE